MKAIKLHITVLLIGSSSQLFGQAIADFTVPVDACIDEEIEITNNSSNASGYEWDYCIGDLAFGPSTELVGNYSGNPYSHVILQENGNWYGFMIMRTDNLIRLDYGNSLANSPTQNNLGNIGGHLSAPHSLSMIQNDLGNWFGFAINFNNGNLVRYDFGLSLTNLPTASNLGNFSEQINSPDDLEIVKDGNSFIGFVASTTNLIYLDFGSDVSTPPTAQTITISGSSRLWGISLVNHEGNWFGLSSNFTSGNRLVFHLDFSSGFTSPTVTNIDLNTLGASRNRDVTFQADANQFYGYVITDDAELIRMDFGNTPNSTSPTLASLGDIDSSTGNNIVSFLLNKNQSEWVGFSTDFNSNVYRTVFPNNCAPNSPVSNLVSPAPISYSESGVPTIGLVAYDVNGYPYATSQTITINPDIAPSISFTTDNSCVSFEGAFDAGTPDLTYAWDFGDGSTGSGQNTSHQFASAGTYTVRLDVDNGTCENFTEQEITIYEEPPVPDFEVVGNLCADGEIIFNNLTDDALYEGPISYEWNFNDQSTSTTRDASFVFGGSGMKTVTLTSSIPGCENFSQTVIDLEPGPTSLFSTSSVCQNDLMTFTNQSADATSYEWDFGDGFTSTQPDVSHVYTESGNFMVTLEAFDEDGCSAIYEQEVAISPEPATDFSYDIACKGNQGVEFIDQSTVEGADILSWEWRINDQLVSTEQSPTLSFDETGNVDVSLTVTSSNGCSKAYEETLNVLEDPDPAFNSEVSCQSLVSTFTDTSLNPEEIVSRVWEIEGQTYTTEEVNHTFSGSGQIDVNLTVTGQNFCSSTLYSTVTVPPAPVLDFSVSSVCSNEEIIFQDISTATDPIVSRSWTLDGTPFFNGSTAVIEELAPGDYSIGLTTLSESGCSFTLEQPLEIFDAPSASFTSSVSYGVPPFTLNLTNTSAGADGQQWLVNGTEVATSANTSYTITSEGDYQVELVATNTEGCEDRSSLNVISRVPAINLVASNLTLTPNGNSQIISLQVTNNGNLPVEIFDVFVSSSKDFSFSERINQYLDIGGQSSIQLNSALQANSAQRICIKVQSAYDDIDPDNNEACINFTPKVVFEDMYPNPIDEEAVVRFILPEASKVRVFISNSTGKIITDQTSSFEKGLQVLRYNSSQWEKGLYFVTVQYNGEMTTRRVLKF